MKTLQKPAFYCILLTAAVYLLLSIFSNGVQLSLVNYAAKDMLDSFLEFRSFLFVVSIPPLIFFVIHIFTNKESRLKKQYYNLFMDNPMPMGIVDSETQRFVDVNKASIDCYGYDKSEFSLMTVNDIRVEDEPAPPDSRLKKGNYGLKKGGVNKHKKKNGEIILTEVSYTEITFKNKRCRLFLASDITEIIKAREEKKIAEEKKTMQENFTAFVLENFPVDVAVFDTDHRYILLNKTAVKNDEMRKWMIGKDDFDYFARKGTDMSMAEKRRERFIKATGGESTEWIDEHIVNGELKYILRKFFPYHEDGKVKYVYGYGTDITEIKKAQMQRDAYLEQLEKMAFTTSHQIRQPICNLQGLVSLLEMGNRDIKELEKIIACMKTSVISMDDCTRELAVKLHEYKQNLTASNVLKDSDSEVRDTVTI